MSRSKKTNVYVRQSFETKKAGKTTGEPFSAIYSSMIGSEAWQALTKNAMILYVYMKMQLFGNSRDGLPENQFYFNRTMYMNTYKLYKNPNQFAKDRDILVAFGFIDYIEKGRTTRTKSIYQFSDKWQNIDVAAVKKTLEEKKAKS